MSNRQLEEWLALLSGFTFGDLVRAESTPPTTARELLFQLACAAQRGEPDALAMLSHLAREMGLPTDLEAISELAGIFANLLADPAVRAEGKPLPPVSELLPKELAQALNAKMGERADRALNPKAPHGMCANPGRPRERAYDWAWAEIRGGRSEDDVYEEWRRRPDVVDRWQQMEDPREAFRSAMKRRKQGRTKPT